MRKKKRGRKFNRERGQRKALFAALCGALFLNEKIRTTEAKAKEMSGFAEKLITRAKKGGLASRRLLLRILSKKIVGKLFNELASRYKERKGGYTRIVKLGRRKNDGAKMAIIELVK